MWIVSLDLCIVAFASLQCPLYKVPYDMWQKANSTFQLSTLKARSESRGQFKWAVILCKADCPWPPSEIDLQLPLKSSIPVPRLALSLLILSRSLSRLPIIFFCPLLLIRHLQLLQHLPPFLILFECIPLQPPLTPTVPPQPPDFPH